VRELLSGLAAAFAVVSALFFLRFWRVGGDRLFGAFAAAFGLMAVNQVALGLTEPSDESRYWLYVVRLAAFLVILLTIVDRSRREE
jgi:hypothetical protein